MDELEFDVPITWDDGSVDFGLKSRQMIITNDTTNSSPLVRYPPIWEIRGGCDRPQVFKLQIDDPDGDRVLCNYGYPVLSGNSSNKLKDKLNSIRLDVEKCKLTYYPSLDDYRDGYKLISLVVEDFRQNELEPKSSSTLSFLAKINSALECNPKPIISVDTSHAGYYYYNETNPIDKTLVVASSITHVADIYADNVACSRIDRTNTTLSTVCNLSEPESCISAFDMSGIMSEICVKPRRVEGELTWSIERLAGHFLGLNVTKLYNYGCSGQGTFNPLEPTYGKPIDNIDRAFQEWKRCRKCAGGASTGLDYYFVNDSCGKLYSVIERNLQPIYCLCANTKV